MSHSRKAGMLVWFGLLALLSADVCRAGKSSELFTDEKRSFEWAALKKQFDSLESKMMVKTTSDIELLVDGALEHVSLDESTMTRETFRDSLVDLVYRSSVFGNIQSFDLLKSEILERGIQVYTDGNGASLADALYYVMKQKAKDDEIQDYMKEWQASRDPWWVGANPHFLFLLDPLMVNLMSDYGDMRDEIYIAFISKGNAMRGMEDAGGLAVPIGLFGGVNMFTQLQADRIIIDLALKLSEYVKNQPNMECQFGRRTLSRYPCWQRAVLRDCVMNELDKIFGDYDGYDRSKVESEMEWLGELPYPLPSADLATVDMIADNLRPKIPTWNEYQTALEKPMSCGIGNVIASVLDEYGRFLSFNNLAQFAIDIHQKLSTRTIRGAVPPIESYYYYIPERLKSYSIVIFLYFMNAPPGTVKAKHIIRSGGSAPMIVGMAKQANSPIALLDDVSASGDSMVESIQHLRTQPSYRGITIIPIPLLATETAVDRFVGESLPLRKEDYEMVPSPRHSKWMGELGYGSESYFITFPYMSPDNDVAAIRVGLAELFTFRGEGVKLKNIRVTMPVCTVRQRLSSNRKALQGILGAHSSDSAVSPGDNTDMDEP